MIPWLNKEKWLLLELAGIVCATGGPSLASARDSFSKKEAKILQNGGTYISGRTELWHPAKDIYVCSMTTVTSGIQTQEDLFCNISVIFKAWYYVVDQHNEKMQGSS